MTIQLNVKDRDELIALLEEHKRLALAMAKMDDPKWDGVVALSTDEDNVERGEDCFIELSFSKGVILEVLTERYNAVLEELRHRDIELELLR